jgi:Outer membrane lipoprotein-sorting protein
VKRAWIVLAGGLLVAPALGDAGVDQVLACVRKNVPATALVQSVELVTTDKAGQERSQSAKLFAKRGEDGRGRLLLRIEDPPDLRGSAFLLVQTEKGNDMFVYLPELKKVRRISTRNLRGKLFGTDFSYEDVEQLFAQSEGATLARLPDAEQDGRAVYVLEAKAAADVQARYTRVTSMVDRQTCVPLEISFYEESETPTKVIRVDAARITKEGEVYVPRLVKVRDLQKNTESRLVTHDVRVDPELADRMFSSTALELH